MDLKLLSAPFPPDRISWRVGPMLTDKTKGIPLAYIDARDVMDRLDQVCGPENWSDDYPHIGQTTVCRISILIDNVWVGKSDGSGTTDVEAEKGQLSDAFKRAGYKWGIGRYLYDIKASWVKIEPRGKSFVIADSEYPRLEAMLPKPEGYVTVNQEVARPTIQDAVKEFVKRLDAATSLNQVTSLVANNNKLMLALSQQDKPLFEKISQEINKTQEAFHMAAE